MSHDAPRADGSGEMVAPSVSQDSHGSLVAASRIFALAMVVTCFSFLLNNLLNFWLDWPGVPALFADLGLSGAGPGERPLSGGEAVRAWVQLASYLIPLALTALFVVRTSTRTLHEDSDVLSEVAAYIIRAAFWGVLLIGLVDAMISFLRVEGLLTGVVGEGLARDLGRTSYRGQVVHYPLLAVSCVIAYYNRSLGFTWLALLIVVAEIQLVIARFIFSYEQAFMGDLVRFWYGALFLFASPYTLVKEGHVRVDILYSGFTERGKAWTNTIGATFLGLPLCWVILTLGLWNKASTINGPMLSFEVTQSGFGMYVKYLLAGFLLVFAVTMLVQFMSYFMSSVAVLLRQPGRQPDFAEHATA